MRRLCILYIVDGHHRAKSLANVYDLRKAEGRCTPDAELFISVLFAHYTVLIYGCHRLVRDITGMNSDQFIGDLALRFTVAPVEKVDTTKNAIPSMVVADDGSTHIIHLYMESQWYELTRSADPQADAIASLDVSLLQEICSASWTCVVILVSP